MKEARIIVIGAGPVGLYAASELEKRGEDYLLIESEDYLGGQISKFYPQKLVVDVPLFGECKAIDIVNKLSESIDKTRVRLREEVLSITCENQNIIIKTASDSYLTKNVIVATGLGRSLPRPLGVEKEKECSNILYDLQDPKVMEGKEVAIFGGGDSALDWARDLSRVAKRVSLIHRRTEFRGDASTIAGCDVSLYLPYIPKSVLVKNNKATSVTIENVADHSLLSLNVDYIFVNFGQVPTPSTFGFPLSTNGFGLIHKEHYEIAPHIYAAGDVCYDESKRKRMLPGFEEINEILRKIEKEAR